MLNVSMDQTLQAAIQHHQAGRLPQAEALYRQVIQVEPNNAEAYRLLGILANQAGNGPMAVQLLQRAVTIQPALVDAWHNLAVALTSIGQWEPAIAAFKKTIELRPDFIDAYCNLMVTYRTIGQPQEAVIIGKKALHLRSDIAALHNDLGSSYEDNQQLDEAVASYRNAIALDPNDAQGYSNLASAIKDTGQWEEARAACEQAIQLKYDFPIAHWNYALILLAMGDFSLGWQEFEWRFNIPVMNLGRGFAQKQWDGADPSGKTILLHQEGGFGDALQFIRLVPLLRDRSAKLILECKADLIPLFSQVPALKCLQQIIPRGQALPPFDLHSPLQSLPRILGITLDNIPNAVPYLNAPADLVKQWAARIPSDGKLNVGLMWAGSQGDRRLRSRSLDRFACLAAVPNVRFYSLQVGPESNQANNPPPGMNLVNHTADLTDFAQTAALVQNLDLVITVDTSIAHLVRRLGQARLGADPPTRRFPLAAQPHRQSLVSHHATLPPAALCGMGCGAAPGDG